MGGELPRSQSAETTVANCNLGHAGRTFRACLRRVTRAQRGQKVGWRAGPALLSRCGRARKSYEPFGQSNHEEKGSPRRSTGRRRRHERPLQSRARDRVNRADGPEEGPRKRGVMRRFPHQCGGRDFGCHAHCGAGLPSEEGFDQRVPDECPCGQHGAHLRIDSGQGVPCFPTGRPLRQTRSCSLPTASARPRSVTRTGTSLSTTRCQHRPPQEPTTLGSAAAEETSESARR